MSTLTAQIIADFRTSLATALAVGGTSVTLQSATDDDGVALPAGKYYFSCDGENSQKEHFYCDLSGTSLTNIKSVSRQGVQTSGAVRAHRIGASMVITNFGHLKYINDLIKGSTALNAVAPLSYDGTATITGAHQLATKDYVDGVAIAGAPKATDTVYGIAKLSIAASDPLVPIVIGNNDSSATGSGNKVVRGNGGFIDASWGGGTSSIATLNSLKKVVENPASATTVAAAGVIPISDGNGLLDTWVTGNIMTYVAGEDIDASAFPVPVYLKASDGKIYKLTAATAGESIYGYRGFAIIQSAVTTNNNIKVQNAGRVSGFSGLTPGSLYFGSNTAGTINVTAGTVSYKAGQAVTASTLLIEMGKKIANGTISLSATGTTTISTGFRPSAVRVSATNRATNGTIVLSNGGWNATSGNNCSFVSQESGAANTPGINNTAWYLRDNVTATPQQHSGVIDTITTTGFNLNNTKTNAPSAAYLFWEAEG